MEAICCAARTERMEDRALASQLILATPSSHHLLYSTINRRNRREGQGRPFKVGDVLESFTNHLASRMIRKKVLGRTSILEGWWGFGMV